MNLVPSTNRSLPFTKEKAAPAMSMPIQFVKGVGPGLGARFAARGIHIVGDLLAFLPRSYLDRTRVTKVRDLEAGQQVSLRLQIRHARRVLSRNRKMRPFQAMAFDESGEIVLRWFKAFPDIDRKIVAGSIWRVSGMVKFVAGGFEIHHPEIQAESDTLSAGGSVGASDPHVDRWVPVYSEIEGIPSKTIRKAMWNAFACTRGKILDPLPARLLSELNYPNKATALEQIHFPPLLDRGHAIGLAQLNEMNTSFHERFIFEEFFRFEWLMIESRMKSDQVQFPSMASVGELEQGCQRAARNLPFQLTGDQKQAVTDILRDLSRTRAMHRLVQGDVGCGKTAVALLSAAAVMYAGKQVAFLAPTEILAEQHYRQALVCFGEGLRVLFLAGKTKARDRAEILSVLASGEPVLLVGTHALLEDSVQFRDLSLLIIDEQHRFGVDQRRKLREKARVPHTLLMTATPIPRTLALTVYGDLDSTLISEKPKGRKPIRTHIVPPEWRSRAIERIREELVAGRQVYWVFPLIEESEAEGFENFKDLMTHAERLQNEIYPEFRIGVLHGAMKPEEKITIMNRFLKQEIDLLAATTVIEVGVDNPQATVMAIENADRFGLSQLHQLRGRVGRGSYDSFCFLMTATRKSETAESRLRTLEKTEDGFEIARADLEIRGPGEFLGRRQAGQLPFILADLVRDESLMLRARNEVLKIYSSKTDLLSQEISKIQDYFNSTGEIEKKTALTY